MIEDTKSRNLLYLKMLYLLPKNAISRMAGILADLCLPKFILDFAIKIFVRHYRIDMTEAATSSFKTFNEFFTRPVRPECRPIDMSPHKVASPVDGTIGAFGKIENDTLFQAKGISYSLKDLVVNPRYLSTFRNGYYLTIYLSPKNYHRIHSPIDGIIQELFYIPGNLFPVNSFAVHSVPGLFTLNERLISIIHHKLLQNVAIVKVGATVVGKIKVVYDTVQSNKRRSIIQKQHRFPITKGSEIGRFQMGSTVILLFEADKTDFSSLTHGQEVRFGQPIGDILNQQDRP